MDLQKFADSIAYGASIYSFEILPDGSFGEIMITAANDGFKAFFAFNPNAPKFEPGMPYRKLFYDPNFEIFCYRCASTNEPLYSYVNAHGAWLSGMYFPIASDKKNIVNCCYILKISKEVETDELSKRSAEIGADVLNMSIKLHKKQDFIQSIADAASDIKKICSSQKCSIVLVDKSKQSCTFINEDGKNDEYMIKLAIEMGRTPYETAVAWEKSLAGSDCLLLDDLSVVKERDKLWYDSLVCNGIESIVLYAVKFNNELVGFIWAANFDVANIMKIKETLELSTFFIGAVIANHQLLDKLETMSMYDMLTDVKNRNAMNNRTDVLEAGFIGGIGIVVTDLNGLKEVNDRLGHTAGDKLLIKAASLIKATFGDCEIYRAGGDEFVILCPDITEDELERRTEELRSLTSQTPDVRIAIGSHYCTGSADIRRSMQIADEKMYADKQLYYRQHPDKRRKDAQGL